MVSGVGRKPGKCGVLEATGKRATGRRESVGVSDVSDRLCNMMTEN